MSQIGTPGTQSAMRVLLLGAGELGKELVIELQRLGCETIAVDRYENAPAMQVAHRSHVVSMLDGEALRVVIEIEQPDYIVPEIEAIATQTLLDMEGEGYTVIPTARAAWLTMDRVGIRRLAAEELGLPTSDYRFAETPEQYRAAINEVGLPCVVKPAMSSSGKGQTLVRGHEEVQAAWDHAQSGGRAGSYRESWQPQAMSDEAMAESKRIALAVTEALGGRGVFGVELFVQGNQVWFNEVSPRPHDTGMVTMISQDLSQFALHARAIVGLPIPAVRQMGPCASAVLMVEGESTAVSFCNLHQALKQPDTQLRLFGKPDVSGQRRMGVALARDEDVTLARAKAMAVIEAIDVQL